MTSPLWISHRGLAQNATENTAAAFTAAFENGFTHCETDLRLTADGHLVLAHDPHLRRLAGQSLIIHQTSRQELEKIPLPCGHRMLFWDEWESRFSDHHWTLDIKRETAPEVIRFLTRWARDRKKEDWLRQAVRFVCWSKSHETLLQQHLPGVVCYARREECYRAGLASLLGLPFAGGLVAGRVYALSPRLLGIPLFRPSLIQRYHQRGAGVVAFLPESAEDTEQAISCGCDEILTNHPLPKKHQEPPRKTE